MYSSGKVSFAPVREAVQAVKQELEKTGYSALELQFDAYPLNHKIMEKMEEQSLKEGLIQEDKRKDAWTKKDDAYLVYA